MSTRVPIVRAAGEGDKQSFLGGGLHTWKLMAEDTGDVFLFEDVMTQGKCTPLHRHPEADETVYVLEEILVNVDGQESRVGAGGMTFTPRGVPHAFLVVSDGDGCSPCRRRGSARPSTGAGEPATGAACETVDIGRLQASAKANPRGIDSSGHPRSNRPSKPADLHARVSTRRGPCG